MAEMETRRLAVLSKELGRIKNSNRTNADLGYSTTAENGCCAHKKRR